jgi:7,8-dihydropterin-6-yl-methyl-4-(beta-D-ribofuranosyl)aminobenzene 5'-phosphate synthase
MNKPVRITILMDNAPGVPSLLTEHGLSVWLDFGDKRLLWDTGQTEKLFDNAQRLNVDISSADAVILSHGHYDHTGGLSKVIQAAPTAKVYLHPKAVEPKYSLKNSVTRSIGMSRDAQLQLLEREVEGGVVFVDGRTEVFKGIVLTGPVPRCTSFENTGGHFYGDLACTVVDDLADDQNSLFFESDEKPRRRLGCAIPGRQYLNAVALDRQRTIMRSSAGCTFLMPMKTA